MIDQIYKYLRWLSLDIVLGAIFFLAYLGKIYQLSIEWPTYIALGSAIWLIYTTDHLMDAANTTKPSSGRHAFHRRNFRLLIFISGLVMILSLGNIWFLDEHILRNGAIISAISVAYLMLVYFLPKLWIKELLVAIVYAVGIFLAPFSAKNIAFLDIIYLCQLAGIALLNLLIFSVYDHKNDLRDGFNSLVLKLGMDRSNRAIKWLSIMLVASCFILRINGSGQIQMLYFTMTTLLFFVHQYRAFFKKNERFRTIGDGVFYLPGIFILLF